VNKQISLDKRKNTSLKKLLFNKYQKHLQLARSKSSAGHRIRAENNYPDAEHFFRSAAEQKVTSG
jgi:hypothetical protein